ncbi:MAG: GAF domain-containing protein [Caldithrix sp.]|nr:MAG: GAF domain-containing protein [Caldithrix sp.]
MSATDVSGNGIWSGIFDSFAVQLREKVEFESASLFIFDSTSDTLKEVAHVGDGIDFISAVNFPMGSGLSAWVAQKGKIIHLPDIHRGSRHGMNPVRSYLAVPLEMNNRVVGVLNLGHISPNAFSGSNYEMILDLSRKIARKIYNQTYFSMIGYEEASFFN